jgi:hypothetical protein
MIAEKNMGVTAARMARSLVLIAKGLWHPLFCVMQETSTRLNVK